MKKKITIGINIIQYLLIIVLDLKYVSYDKDAYRQFIHIAASLTIFPLLIAAIFNLVFIVFMKEEDSFLYIYKRFYVYSLCATLFVFLIGLFAFIATR